MPYPKSKFKIIELSFAISLIVAMILLFFIAPPCNGSYSIALGGEQYFLFNCEANSDNENQNSVSGITQKNSRVFQVLSVDHSSRHFGKFFNFDVKKINKILGHKNWNGIKVKVNHKRESTLREVVLWNKPNGGSVGNGHGRLTKNVEPNYWKPGDLIEIMK